VIRLGPCALALALALLAAGGAPGCGMEEGGQGPPVHPGDIERPRSLLLGTGDVKRVGSSTPYGALLRWWRALQEGDVRALQRSYAGRVGASTARRQIDEFEPPFAQPVKPTEDEGRKRATVEVTVRAAVRLGDLPHVIGVHDFPASFELVREGSRWKVRDNAYTRYRHALLDELAKDL
jgi:hypothetical protein